MKYKTAIQTLSLMRTRFRSSNSHSGVVEKLSQVASSYASPTKPSTA